MLYCNPSLSHRLSLAGVVVMHLYCGVHDVPLLLPTRSVYTTSAHLRPPSLSYTSSCVQSPLQHYSSRGLLASFLGHGPVGLLSSLRLRDRIDEKGKKRTEALCSKRSSRYRKTASGMPGSHVRPRGSCIPSTSNARHAAEPLSP